MKGIRIVTNMTRMDGSGKQLGFLIEDETARFRASNSFLRFSQKEHGVTIQYLLPWTSVSHVYWTEDDDAAAS